MGVKFNFKESGLSQASRSFESKGLLFGYSKALLSKLCPDDEPIVHFIFLKKEHSLPQIIQYIGKGGDVKAILNADAMVWNGDKSDDTSRENALLEYM